MTIFSNHLLSILPGHCLKTKSRSHWIFNKIIYFLEPWNIWQPTPFSHSQARKTSVPTHHKIDAADIKKVLGGGNVNADDADINRLLESVKGKPIHELIAEGTAKIGATAPAPAAGGAPAADAKKKEEPKKEEKKKEEKKKEAPPPDDDDDFMAGGLFDWFTQPLCMDKFISKNEFYLWLLGILPLKASS